MPMIWAMATWELTGPSGTRHLIWINWRQKACGLPILKWPRPCALPPGQAFSQVVIRNRVGIGGALNPHATIGLNPEEETIAELVKRAGNYKTAMYGKWHLGHLKPFLPLQQGFDEYVGIPYSNDMWKWTYDMQLATEATHARKASYPELPLMAGDTVWKTIEDLDDQAQLTTIYTERAVDFIRKNKDRPFLLCVPHSMPHVPLAVSGKFKGKE